MLTRRKFIGNMAVAGAGLPLVGLTGGSQTDFIHKPEQPICIFSKHLQWLSVPEMAETVASLGFDGVDLSVRKGGHVEPGQAVVELPRAVEILKKVGLQVPMMVTDIVDADHPDTEMLLKTASKLGIQYYRMGYFKYDQNIGVAKSLDLYKKQIQKLAILNRKYDIHGAYQNHSGATNVGGAVWDIRELLQNVDPRWTGCQYDIKHAVSEGGMSWVNGLDVLKSYIRCLDIKDFIWAKKNGKWQQQQVPLGEGMVDFGSYLSLLKKHGITGPFSIHYEYPLGGAESGKKQITMSRDEVLAAMKRDLQIFKKLIKENSSAG